ncbi:hypothetical protein HK101_007962 [Irineochytrium annulatum]|nr:hypothetical protein HK101_007962 [Irineochytrium annulatum]
MKEPTARERKRQTQSCDRCRAKKRKCDALQPSCTNCLKAKQPCTMLVEPKKRGPKKNRDLDVSGSSSIALEAGNGGPSASGAVLAANGGLSGIVESDDEEYSEEDSMSSTASATRKCPIDAVIAAATAAASFGMGPLERQQLEQMQPQHQQQVSLQQLQQQLTRRSPASGSGTSPSLLNAILSPSRSDNSDDTNADVVKDLWSVVTKSFAIQSPKACGDVSSVNTTNINPSFEAFNFSNLDPRLLFDPTSGMIAPDLLHGSSGLQNDHDFISLFPPFTNINAGPAIAPVHVVERTPMVEGLTIADFPEVPSDFYLHLIKNFFTFFHPGLPLIDERQFFENLVPTNKHHPMLMSAIYSIGCLFSKHPILFLQPFYSPHRASDIFSNRAASLIPATASKAFRNFETVPVCQATLILSINDFGLKKGQRSWMFNGMGCSLSTGITPLINESDYFQTFLDEHGLMASSGDNDNFQDEISLLALDNRWMEVLSSDSYPTIFSGFPNPRSPTVLGDVLGQTAHLFSNSAETLHLVQVCFVLRKIFRYGKGGRGANPVTENYALSLLAIEPFGQEQLHSAVVALYEALPPKFRIIDSLEDFALNRPARSPLLHQFPFADLPSAAVVLLNMLFFMGVVLLHYRSVGPKPSRGLTFRLSHDPSSTAAFSSADVCATAYRAQCHILRLLYPIAPSPSRPPLVQAVASPIFPCLLMPAATVLLNRYPYDVQLCAPPIVGSTPQGVLEPLAGLFLPVLDNIGQVWPTAMTYATHLRQQIQICKERKK